MDRQRLRIIIGVAISIASFLCLMELEYHMRPYAKDGVYFQKWSSEDMMQTVSLTDLRNAPLQSLLHIHIQPPGFDALRAVIVQFWSALNPMSATIDLLPHVDKTLYVVWAALYALLGFLIFWWLSAITAMWFAAAAAVFFQFHPACIYYATLLDATYLSTFLILCLYYLLWKLKNDAQTPIWPFTLAALACFFVRSLFQLPTLALLALSLVLMKIPRRKVVIFLLGAGLVAGAYVVKQQRQFGLSVTSSFMGFNLSRSIGQPYLPLFSYLKTYKFTDQPDPAMPGVMRRESKLTGTANFNNYHYLELNRTLIKDYKTKLRAMSLTDLIAMLRDNLRVYFMPSTNCWSHGLVDRLSWREFYDGLFSAPLLPVLLLIAGALWGARGEWRVDPWKSVGFVLPALYLFLVVVCLERDENMRLKFMLEPLFFLFIAAQFFAAGGPVKASLSGLFSPKTAIAAAEPPAAASRPRRSRKRKVKAPADK